MYFFRKGQEGKVRKRIQYQRGGKTFHRWQWVNQPTGELKQEPIDITPETDYRTHLAYVMTEGAEKYRHLMKLASQRKPPEEKPRKLGQSTRGTPLAQLTPAAMHAVVKETDELASKYEGKWVQPTAHTGGFLVKRSGTDYQVKFMKKKPEAKFKSMSEAIAYIRQESGPNTLKRVHEQQDKPAPKLKMKETLPPQAKPQKPTTKKRKEVTTRVALRRIKPGSHGQVGGHTVYRNLSGTYEMPGGVKAKNLASAVKHMTGLKVNKPSKEETVKTKAVSLIEVGSKISFGRYGETVTGKVTKVSRKGNQVVVTVGGTEYNLASYRKVKFMKGEQSSRFDGRTSRLVFTPDGNLYRVWH